MVGIVVVSHSHALARAAVGIAQEMLHGREVSIAVAAGLDETTFGTDAVQVQAAIERVDSPDGVLVLMDLGSAVLSAELALDLLDTELAARVRLCPAPLVEGLVAATVAAAGGASLAEVESEAVAALAGKQAHLHAPGEPDTSSPDVRSGDEPAVRASFVVANAHGLHARPAARLVAEVRTLDARVRLRNLTTGSAWVPGSSLSRVATLGALAGHEIEVGATGSQAREAVDHILALAARQFDEADGAAGAIAPSPGPAAGPYPASPGIGIGPAWRPGDPAGMLETKAAAAPSLGDQAAEWRRVRSAVAVVRRETVQTRARTARELGEGEAGVFDAHLMLLDDTELLEDVRHRIEAGASAPAAWSAAMQGIAAELEALPDEYQRARAADVRALHDQVVLALLGRSSEFTAQAGVLVAADLTPAQAAALDRETVAGIVLAYGSPTAHSAILARSRGIPAVVAAGPDVLGIADGTMVALDGETGRLVVDPDAEALVQLKAQAAERDRLLDEAKVAAALPAVTSDGTEIHVAANVGSVDDATTAAAHGADLAGLVRTEFLFLDRDAAPSIDEQEAAYRSVSEALAGRRTVIRTLDVGGDKPLPYIDQPVEANPFLGLRGLRLALTTPDLLRDQLAAISRVAADHPVSVMFPMVSHVDEILAARRLLAEVARPWPDGLEVGMMIEVPAAALKAAAFVPHVDFVSIGTNDLTQYALAAERGNEAVAATADPLDPGVLRLIDAVCRAAADSGVRVAVCGEAAADPAVVPLLLGLGVEELSVVPYSVPVVKQIVRGLSMPASRDLARRALDQASAAEVRALIM
ncbi:MAG TPA: phosphoenolpyruvate--protein phosphotransferase [Jiangellaceae bacterium]